MPKVPGHSTEFGLGGVAENVQLTDAAAQTYKQGALVVLDGAGNVTECGADPALIYGLANGPAGVHPEGTTQTTITKLGSGQKVWMPFSVAAPTRAANESKNYGVVKDADGIWTIDVAEVVNTRLYVHFVDEDMKLGLCSILPANRQIP